MGLAGLQDMVRTALIRRGGGGELVRAGLSGLLCSHSGLETGDTGREQAVNVSSRQMGTWGSWEIWGECADEGITSRQVRNMGLRGHLGKQLDPKARPTIETDYHLEGAGRKGAVQVGRAGDGVQESPR